MRWLRPLKIVMPTFWCWKSYMMNWLVPSATLCQFFSLPKFSRNCSKILPTFSVCHISAPSVSSKKSCFFVSEPNLPFEHESLKKLAFISFVGVLNFFNGSLVFASRFSFVIKIWSVQKVSAVYIYSPRQICWVLYCWSSADSSANQCFFRCNQESPVHLLSIGAQKFAQRWNSYLCVDCCSQCLKHILSTFCCVFSFFIVRYDKIFRASKLSWFVFVY